MRIARLTPLLLVLAACAGSPVGPEPTGQLHLEIQHAGPWSGRATVGGSAGESAGKAADESAGKAAGASRVSVVLRRDGGSPETHSLTRAAGAVWRSTLELRPATYIVTIEAYDVDRLRWSGVTSVTVEAGRTATARVEVYETASGTAVAQLLATNACVDCDLRDATLQGQYLREANLQGAELDGANLALSHLQYANLRGASLRQAYLIGASVRYANLADADLRGANLSEANFTSADLRQANLGSADLLRAVFDDANLESANLAEANITGASFVGARLGGATWPDGERCPDGFVGTAATGSTRSCTD